MSRRPRIAIMHGVNLDMLGRRDPAHYGSMTLPELEAWIGELGPEMGLELTFFQTNSEEKLVEWLHRARDVADGLVLNPGAWTHYAWSLRDALEIAAVPAVEVHLSAVDEREPWRRESVIRELCIRTVSGRGAEGYREALEALKQELDARAGEDPSQAQAEQGGEP